MVLSSLSTLLAPSILVALYVRPAAPAPRINARPAVELLLRDSQSLELLAVETGTPTAMHLVLPLEWRSLSNANAPKTAAGYKIPYTARVRCIATVTTRSGQEEPVTGKLCEPAGRDTLMAPFVWIPNALQRVSSTTLANSTKRAIKTGQIVTVRGYVYAYRRKTPAGPTILVSYPYADLTGVVTLPLLP